VRPNCQPFAQQPVAAGFRLELKLLAHLEAKFFTLSAFLKAVGHTFIPIV